MLPSTESFENYLLLFKEHGTSYEFHISQGNGVEVKLCFLSSKAAILIWEIGSSNESTAAKT